MVITLRVRQEAITSGVVSLSPFTAVVSETDYYLENNQYKVTKKYYYGPKP